MFVYQTLIFITLELYMFKESRQSWNLSCIDDINHISQFWKFSGEFLKN